MDHFLFARPLVMHMLPGTPSPLVVADTNNREYMHVPHRPLLSVTAQQLATSNAMPMRIGHITNMANNINADNRLGSPIVMLVNNNVVQATDNRSLSPLLTAGVYPSYSICPTPITAPRATSAPRSDVRINSNNNMCLINNNVHDMSMTSLRAASGSQLGYNAHQLGSMPYLAAGACGNNSHSNVAAVAYSATPMSPTPSRMWSNTVDCIGTPSFGNVPSHASLDAPDVNSLQPVRSNTCLAHPSVPSGAVHAVHNNGSNIPFGGDEAANNNRRKNSNAHVSDFSLVDVELKSARQKKGSKKSGSAALGVQPLLPAPNHNNNNLSFDTCLSVAADRSEEAIRQSVVRLNLTISMSAVLFVDGTGDWLLESPAALKKSSVTGVAGPHILLSLCKKRFFDDAEKSAQLKRHAAANSHVNSNRGHCEETAGSRRYAAHDASNVSFRFEVCDHFFKRKCRYGPQCVRLHVSSAFVATLLAESEAVMALDGGQPRCANNSDFVSSLPPLVICDIHWNREVTGKQNVLHATHDDPEMTRCIAVKRQKDTLLVPISSVVVTRGSALIVTGHPSAASKPQLCSHYARGLCPRGRHCCFVHYHSTSDDVRSGPAEGRGQSLQPLIPPQHLAHGDAPAPHQYYGGLHWQQMQ